MKQKNPSWSTLLLLPLVALSLQGCLGSLGSSSGRKIATSSSGQQVSVNQDVFTGKFYLTINNDLYVLNGNNTSKELVNAGNVMDPAVSPDGKWVVFVEKFKQYSNLCVVSASGGKVQVLLNGNGSFFSNDGGFIHNTYHWFAQPAWSQDGSTLLFLSDLQKDTWPPSVIGQDASLLDLQVFSIPFSNPSATPTAVAYATYDDGGDQNPSYRPGHPDQIIYTHYTYQPPTNTQQQIQLFMENPTTISTHPGVYYPGSPGGGYDPGVAITTPDTIVNDPAFSPNGNAIAYIQTDTMGNQMELNVMPVPSATITQTPNNPTTEGKAVLSYEHHSSHLLTQLFLSEPVWSPNGKQIAYIAYSANTFDLWISNLNYNAKTNQYSVQGSPIQVTSGGIDAASHPVWTN